MEFVKVIGVGMTGVAAILVLKSAKNEYAPLATIATGVVLLVMIMDGLKGSVKGLTDVAALSGLPNGLYTGILKIIGIGYLTEYSAAVASDAGCASVGEKLQLAGKIGIFLMSMPMLTALIKVVGELR